MCFGKSEVLLTLVFSAHKCSSTSGLFSAWNADSLLLNIILHFILHTCFEVKECLFQTTYKFRQATQRKVNNLSLSFIWGGKAAADVHSSTSKWIAVTSTVVSWEKKNKSARPTSPYNENMWPDKWKKCALENSLHTKVPMSVQGMLLSSEVIS